MQASTNPEIGPATQLCRGLNAVFLALLLCVPFLYRFTARRAIDPDPFLYAEAAKQVLEGKRLYREAWQDKPPLGILAYALPQIVAPRSYPAIAFFMGLGLVLQALMFWWVFRGSPPAAFSSVLILTLLPTTIPAFIWPSTEHFANVFAAASLLIGYCIFRDRRFTSTQCLITGVLACVVFHVRQTAVIAGCVVPFLGIALADQPVKRKLSGGLLVAAGGLLAWAAILGLVALTCDFRGYVYTVFEYPRLYAHYGHTKDAFFLVKLLFVETLIPTLILLFGGLVMLGRHRLLAMIAVGAGLLAGFLPMRPFLHYWVSVLPALALLVALALDRVDFNPRQFASVTMGSLAALLLIYAGLQLRDSQNYPTHLRCLSTAQLVDRVAPAGSTLMVCGPMTSEAIQFASTLPPANTFSAMFQLTPPWNRTLPRKIDDIYHDYWNHPPSVIVLYKDLFASSSAPFVPRDLIEGLFTRYSYTPVASNEFYIVEVRENAPRGRE